MYLISDGNANTSLGNWILLFYNDVLIFPLLIKYMILYKN